MFRCAKIMPSDDERLGGWRYVCMHERGHAGPCGNWTIVSQPEHAALASNEKGLDNALQKRA